MLSLTAICPKFNDNLKCLCMYPIFVISYIEKIGCGSCVCSCLFPEDLKKESVDKLMNINKVSVDPT